MKSVILSLLFVCQLSFADSVYLGAWSYHYTGTKYVTNSEHNLMAYEHNNYVVGVFKNSYDDWSTLVGKRFGIIKSDNFKLAATIGLVHGYYNFFDENHEDRRKITVFAIVPELSYNKYHIQPTVILIKKAVAITFKVEF